MEDTFEAFVGSMMLDFNSYEIVEQWLVNLLEEHIDFSELITSNTNFKDNFLKYFQHSNNYIPRFFELGTESINNGKIYTVCIKDRNNGIISTGKGPSKKHAENDAAYNALQYLGVLQ